jgi:hypothetical protein
MECAMSTKPDAIQPRDPTGESGFLIGLARFVWALLGPLLLFGALVRVFASPGTWLGGWDAAVALIVGAMIACRWAEQRTGRARTTYGDPSTPAHFRRYALGLIIGAGILWAMANILGGRLLG